jgi:hypothetical protein
MDDTLPSAGLPEISPSEILAEHPQPPSPFFNGTSKPYVRWWWLSGPFTTDDIVRQLEWVRAQGFGGVELAWLYPGWLDEDGDDRARPVWLGPEWSNLVAFTKFQAAALSLGCDFTFGSCWPFGGSWVTAEDALQTFDGLSPQRLDRSWEEPAYGSVFVVNHLSSAALERYSAPLLAALGDALAGRPSALFCDSLEVDTDRLWSPELWPEFERRFGYSLRPFVDSLDTNLDVRYDYRNLIAEQILRQFYQPFNAICRDHHAYARVQCHGAPTDLLEAYAAVDVPESESLLFLPPFSRIAASAAAWRDKPVVSAEAFTCIYGFPGWDDAAAERYWKKEEIGDLELLADALFANGVNQLVWHGMPYQPSGKQVEFYASVHVGPDSPFAAHLKDFNARLEKTSALLKLGKTYSGIGVYLPFEDALMLDHLPQEQRTPGANFHWEMRHAVPPPELEGFHPLWISHAFLKDAVIADGRIRSGNLSLEAISVDCEWLDADSLEELLRLALEGATLIWKRPCREPGRRRHATYASDLEKILDQPNVTDNPAGLHPLLTGQDLPPYWARVLDQDLLLFFAHPKAKQIRYPLPYGFSLDAEPAHRQVVVHWKNRDVALDLQFEPHRSLMLLVSLSGAIHRVSIGWGADA